MMNYFLAVDIGASSGRLILSHMAEGKIVLEEMHRFDNGMVRKGSHLCWEPEKLFEEILLGLEKCRDAGKIPCTIGVDTWGVDYILLDGSGKRIGEAIGYRDKRTEGMDLEVERIIPQKELYARTGIQKAIFNTVYQLMAQKLQDGETLEKAETLLFIPDYIHFLLTGRKVCEYTVASTSNLLDPVNRRWDRELIAKLGLPQKIFIDPVMPGTKIGTLKKEIIDRLGFDIDVIVPASHDTASAVMAVPEPDDAVYISSGTWSLIGIERKKPDCSEKSYRCNFTNEGGYDGSIRYLKNIMGLWMIQSLRHEFRDEYSFAEICDMAEEASDFPSRVDVKDNCFLAPESMIEAIREFCRRSKQQIPETLGELATVCYRSLAVCYAEVTRELEFITGKSFQKIHIVGGGANAVYLNRLTAKETGKEVVTGPTEATALGNVLVQMLYAGVFKNKKEVKECISRSFNISIYR